MLTNFKLFRGAAREVEVELNIWAERLPHAAKVRQMQIAAVPCLTTEHLRSDAEVFVLVSYEPGT